MDLKNNPGYFTCNRFTCAMPIATCIARRERKSAYGHTYHQECQDCKQGEKNMVEQTTTNTSGPSEIPPTVPEVCECKTCKHVYMRTREYFPVSPKGDLLRTCIKCYAKKEVKRLGGRPGHSSQTKVAKDVDPIASLIPDIAAVCRSAYQAGYLKGVSASKERMLDAIERSLA